MEMDLSPHWEYYFALLYFSFFSVIQRISRGLSIDGRVDISISRAGNWGLSIAWKPWQFCFVSTLLLLVMFRLFPIEFVMFLFLIDAIYYSKLWSFRLISHIMKIDDEVARFALAAW